MRSVRGEGSSHQQGRNFDTGKRKALLRREKATQRAYDTRAEPLLLLLTARTGFVLAEQRGVEAIRIATHRLT